MKSLQSSCTSCGAEGARIRHCTKERLCERCRAAPEHKLMRASQVRAVTGLPEAEFLHLKAGTVVNPVNPKFPRLSVFYWKDVADFCMKNGLEIPD